MDLKKKFSKKAPKLSRADSWRRNPIPWLVLLFFIYSIGGYYIIPNGNKWITMRSEIKKFQEEEPELKSKRDNLNIEYEEIKNKYEELASETLKREQQIFPEKINLSKIAKILELYSLILAYDIDDTNYFELASVNFSPPISDEDTPYKVTNTNIKIIGARTNIYNFITFLESGRIPKPIAQKMKNVADVSVDLRYLEQNLLPIATLDSIRINEYKSPEVDLNNLFSVEIQVKFYSQ